VSHGDPDGEAAPRRLGERWGDRIEVRDLRVLGVHGVLPEERVRPQPFALDLDVWLDTRRSGSSDALSDTADYGALVELAAGVVADRSFQLLEALAAGGAGALLAHDVGVRAASVTVRKVRPPVRFDVGSVGVRVVRRRTEPRPEGGD
jgi:dihydroneopterin aldolase